MKGIYKFQNKKNHKVYIGQSICLEKRYNQHKNNHLNINDKGYNTKFYRALRKYGFDNFEYSILEESKELTSESLNSRERYWISYYNSFQDGYNSTPGGQDFSFSGQDHPMAKLTNAQVLEIKSLLASNLTMTQYDIAQKYNITQSVVSEINDGKKWSLVGEYSYPIRKMGVMNIGSNHFRAALTDDQVNEIRKRYMLQSGKKIYEDYKNYCSYVTFERVLRGVSYTNLPIYKKKEKKWIYP